MSDPIPVTLIPGDGIGPEVVDAALVALGAPFEWDRQVAGLEGVKTVGDPLPPETIECIRRTRLALKGPLETPSSGGYRSSNDRIDDDKKQLIELPSPFTLEPGTVRLIEPAEGFDGEQLDRLREGTLGRPFMIDYGGTRNLFFTISAVQSAVHLDYPNALVAAYTRKMMAFLLFMPAPRHVLMIGLGGGSLAKFCYRHLTRTRISVVEISSEVIALREEFAIPPDDERFEIIHDDGAAFLSKARLSPDTILVDAFDEFGVSPSLASSDFYERASRCLTPDGLLVMNLSGQRSRYVAHIEKLRAAFPGVIRVVPVDGEDNVLLFAFRHGTLADFLGRRAAYLEHGLGLDFSRYLQRLRAGDILNGGNPNHGG